MCEIFLRLVSKVNTDPLLDAQCTKRGDVIVVVPDNHPWGNAELNNGECVIVKIPKVSISQASPFLSPELETDILNPNPVLQKRGWTFNINNVPPSVLTKIQTRAIGEKILCDITSPQLDLLRVKKARLSNPLVL